MKLNIGDEFEPLKWIMIKIILCSNTQSGVRKVFAWTKQTKKYMSTFVESQYLTLYRPLKLGLAQKKRRKNLKLFHANAKNNVQIGKFPN